MDDADLSRQTDRAAEPIKPLRRRPGRPLASDPSGDDLREHVLAAARAVYAEHGSQHCSVELLLEASGISRPTFYRLFKDRREVIDVIVGRANDLLQQMISEAVQLHAAPHDMIPAAIDAYFEWGRQLGPLAGAIYNGVNDRDSPERKHRSRVLRDLVQLFHLQAERLGRPRLEPLFYDALIRVIEHVGYTTFWPRQLPEEEVLRRRAIALRIVLAATALPEDEARVPSLQTVELRP